MKAELEQLYGEYMQLKEQADDYLLKNLYTQKMNAIEIILAPMPYKAANPVLSEEEKIIYRVECLTEDGNIEENGYFESLEDAEVHKKELDSYTRNIKYGIKQNIINIPLTPSKY